MGSGGKVWRLCPQRPSETESLAGQLQVSPVVAQLLLNRGIEEPESARRFMAMPFNSLHDPDLMPGMGEAVDILVQAIRDGERVCVYGDYDVDGLTGTAIIWQATRLLGGRVDYYVPHRLDEGYGLNGEALQQIARAGTRVVVTVDCGITSTAEAVTARELQLKLVVTDHHECKEAFPDAVVVHPRLPESRYPFGDLSGSGVAFKLAWALCRRTCGTSKVTPEFREFLLDSVALAALGMVADCVPLHDENRTIVRHGLLRLAQTKSVGLRALLEATGLAERAKLCAADISYALAPRLNAAGRLGCARLVVDLLTTISRERALELTKFLELQNTRRQQIERRITEQARERIETECKDAAAVVLASDEWHPGVIGIVAGRLADAYGKPVLLIAIRPETGIGQGSGRSVPGCPLHMALRSCDGQLIAHGGHAIAAGFRLKAEAIDHFQESFCAVVEEYLRDVPGSTPVLIDAEVPLAAITPRLIEQLDQLEPYGIGNPAPRLLAGPVMIEGEPRRVGRGERHLQFRVRQQQTTLPTIAFNFADRLSELLSAERQCCLVFRPGFNDWQGFRRVQLEVHDFQAGCTARLG